MVLTSTFPRWDGDSEPPFVLELCRRLSSDFDVSVLAPHAPNSKLHDTLHRIDIVRFRYFFDWGESLTYNGGILANLRDNRLRYCLVPLFFVFQLIALLRLLNREKFDIVHAHWLIPQGLTAVMAQLCYRKFPALLCTTHGSDIYGLRGPLFSAIKKLVVRRCTALTAVSQAMKKCALDLGAPTGKTSVISMGVDTSRTFSLLHVCKAWQ
ncbi:MAG: glycosyltransferase [Propionivibrio sp.]|nr:glycosyltransferase [Propionivibrio sp.]